LYFGGGLGFVPEHWLKENFVGGSFELPQAQVIFRKLG